jgi:hypothetical protein
MKNILDLQKLMFYWETIPKINFSNLAKLMIENDKDKLKKEGFKFK